MNEFQQLLEQDLAKIIIAIAILVILLIIVIIYANISSKRKKAKLDNTRTLHKEEFEKAAKKRMELTQAVSRDAIAEELAKKEQAAKAEKSKDPLEQTMVPRRKSAAADEKTMELNLESVRRKLIQDEKAKENTGAISQDTLTGEKLSRVKKIDSDVTAKLDENVVASPVVKVDEKLLDIPDFTLEEDKIDIPDIAVEEKVEVPEVKVEVPEVAVEEPKVESDEAVLDFLSMEESDELSTIDIFEGKSEPELNVVESFDIVAGTDIQDDNIFSSEGFDFVNLDEPAIDIWDDNFGVKPEEAEDVWESNEAFLNDTPNVEDAVDEGIGSVVFDDDEIENENTSLFLGVTSISASEEELSNSIEFVDVEDQSVYVNSFEFGQEYFQDVEVYGECPSTFEFGKNYFEDVEEEAELTNVAFDFDLTKEADYEVEDSNVVFGTFFDTDYTYVKETTSEPIFGNKSYEIDLDDQIDVTLTKAVVVDEEVVVADSTKQETVIEDVVVVEEAAEEVVEEVVLKNENENLSLVVQKPQDNDSFVVDINSQLDKLDTYEMNLLDEFDFADENYNYNFNSINIMEEIVEDMLLDDFVEPSEDEYFKYVYQFALLENMIETKDLEINLDDVGANYTIVDGVDEHLKLLAKKMKEAEVEEAVEELAEVPAVEEVVHKTFEVDSELLNLTSQVIDRSYDEEKQEEESAYKVNIARKNVVSPVFGGSFEDEEEEDLTNSFYDYEEETEAAVEVEEVETAIEVEETVEAEEVINIDYSEEDTLEALYEDTEEVSVELGVEEDQMFDLAKEDSEVDNFMNMISEKMEDEEKHKVETEEEFLDVLKGLIE